jgi:putative ATP-binding cassette transporter
VKVLVYLLRTSPGILLLAGTAAVLSGFCNAGLIAVVHAVLSDPGRFSWLLAAGFVSLVLARLAFTYLSEMVLMRRSQQTIAELRTTVIRKLLAVPYRRFEIVGPARVFSTLTDDVTTINAALFALPGFIVGMAMLAGGTVYLLYLSWRFLLVLVVLVLMGVFFYRLASKNASRFFELARDEYDRLYGLFRALTAGAKELKLHAARRTAFTDGEVARTTESLMHNNVLAHSRHFLARTIASLFFFCLVGLVVFLLPRLHDQNTHVLTGYVLTCLYLMGPLTSVMRTAPIFAAAGVALGRVEQLGLNLQADPDEATVPPGSPPDWKSIELRGVTHTYHGQDEERPFVLGPIDLRLEPGELLFITGGNGSGKSTLAKMLTGLYRPETGEVLWDGQPVADHNRDAYRQLFSAVFSDFHLFEKLLGLDAPHLDHKAGDLLGQLQLERRVRIDAGVLSTVDVSQGQRKRLALLTALLEDRPIYLLDEWAADQDPQFKDTYYKKLIPDLIRQGKTVIVITHDDRYFHLADRQKKMQDGRFV